MLRSLAETKSITTWIIQLKAGAEPSTAELETSLVAPETGKKARRHATFLPDSSCLDRARGGSVRVSLDAFSGVHGGVVNRDAAPSLPPTSPPPNMRNRPPTNRSGRRVPFAIPGGVVARVGVRVGRRIVAACVWWALIGCAAWFPNPGVPARFVSPEVLGYPREAYKTIDLSLLRQTPPSEYRLDSGDVVGVYIDGVLGAKDEVPPVYQPADKELPPAVGYPIAVREDGTITLPMLPPMVVRGLSLRELEDRLRQAYTVDQPVLKAGMERILVSLHKPRMVRVLVMRQEEGNTQSRPVSQPEAPTPSKRGVGRVVALPAYRNDVLNALAETGGLPGQDADNVVYVLRRNPPPHPASLPQPLFASAPPSNLWPAPPVNHPFALATDFSDASVENSQVLRIPLRVSPGEPPPFHEQDILLGDGDVVFLESREDEHFFTAGLLGGGQYTLPRDSDLDVLGAIAVAESNSRPNYSRTSKGIGGVSALNQDVSVGASDVVVFRKLPNGGEMPIKVDLYRALRHPEERILIQPGDRIVLQYSRGEAVLAFLERHLLEGFLIGAATTMLYNRD